MRGVGGGVVVWVGYRGVGVSTIVAASDFLGVRGIIMQTTGKQEGKSNKQK